jgi:Ca-activated chloride channel family protein
MAHRRVQLSSINYRDALIVAIRSGATILYTEDMHPGSRCGALELRNPFLAQAGPMAGAYANVKLQRLLTNTVLALLTAVHVGFAQTPACGAGLSAQAEDIIAPASAQTPTPASAPTPAPAPSPEITTLKVGTTLVAVSAVVRDKSGAPISGLTRDAFLLKQDGKPQQIRYFSQGSDLPLTLALMVDTSGSQRAYIRDEILAGRVFFSAMMKKPADRAVLVEFGSTILQLARSTNSVSVLEHALAYLSQSHDDIPSYTHGGGGTLLFDAICAVSKIEHGSQLGRRAIVILTDGGDNGSRFSEKDAIEAAQRADTMIYSVYYSNGGGDIDVLNDLSKATGGRVFTVDQQMTLPQIYAAIADDMRLQYELGYTPPKSKPNKYHKIALTTKNKVLTVQAREGYFTPK